MAEALLDRDTLDAALWKAVRDAQGFSHRAYATVLESPVCTSVFGDEAACRTLRTNARALEGRVLKFAESTAMVTSKRTEDITQAELDDLGTTAKLITSEAKALIEYSGEVGVWQQVVHETLRQFSRLVASVVRVAAEIAGEAVIGAGRGLFEGLGPVLTIVGLFLLWKYLEAKKAPPVPA